MGAHRRARSARAAARVALCVVALLAAASGASAVSLSETDKRAAHESHHARKARLREELAAAELATREKYEAKVSSLERTTERLRREAEETVASLSAERDAMSRNLTKYKRGLLNLDAKRKSETETLRAETERLRAEREELQSKLEQALDDALSATKAAADAKRESRAIARAAKTEGASAENVDGKRNVDEIPTSDSDARSSSSAAIGLVAGVAETVSGALARAARLATRAGHALRPRNALRVIAAVARDAGWLPLAATATDDDAAACLAAVVAAAALGALAAKGASAAERLARGASWVSARASDDWMGFWGSLGAGRVGRRTRPPPAFPSDASEYSEAPRSASDSDEYELVDDDASNPSLPGSPTRAAADAARSFDAAPEAFERSMRSPGSERENLSRGSERENLVGVSARVAALEASAARGEVSPGEGSPGLEPDVGFFAFASSGASPPPPLGDSEPPLGDSEPPLGASPSAAFEKRKAKSRETPTSKSDWPASSPPIRDGALKSALRRLAEALATPKTARAGHGGTPDPARTSARAPETPASRRAEKTNGACVVDVDDVDDAANRKKSAAETARAAVETPPAFEPGEPHPGSRRRLERAHKSSPASVAKKSPANVTSASLVRTPAPAAAGGRTPGSGDSASSADRGGGASSLFSLGPAPTRARAPVTPRDRMVAYSQKLRRGVPVEIPALDARVSPWGGDAVVAGGVRHPRGWAS